jgi:hypothetical protein
VATGIPRPWKRSGAATPAGERKIPGGLLPWRRRAPRSGGCCCRRARDPSGVLPWRRLLSFPGACRRARDPGRRAPVAAAVASCSEVGERGGYRRGRAPGASSSPPLAPACATFSPSAAVVVGGSQWWSRTLGGREEEEGADLFFFTAGCSVLLKQTWTELLTQTDKNGPLRTPKWVGPLEMP